MTRHAIAPKPSIWAPTTGRELDATPLAEGSAFARVVACLNVWNDRAALERAAPSWIRAVDAVIAVDGSYGDGGLSTDGTREFLSGFPHVTLIDAAGVSQCEQRSLYLRASRPRDLLFIIDADESVENAAAIRAFRGDVGWLRIRSPLYTREYGQPRLIRWMPDLAYRGRHHWIYQGDALVATHQYGGAGYEHRTSPVVITNRRRSGRSRAHLIASRHNRSAQAAVERHESAMPTSTASDGQLGAREALQIVTLAYRDDGLAPSRLHSAINRTTPHSSLFFKERPGPFDVPGQYMAKDHSLLLRQALTMADIVHYHVTMGTPPRGKWTVHHHHGTVFRRNAERLMKDAKNCGALVLLSNLELLSWTNGAPAHFLPNPVPIARYRALREQHQRPFDGSVPFRVAHSPSHPEKKGTEHFLAACARLKSRGVPIEPVVIHGVSHAEALRLKATCHAAFDSFWLGMQCSGVEAGAMGLAVVAGDETVAARYRETVGHVPYTFADSPEELELALERLVSDAAFRAVEAARVSLHVTAHHDESAVALRYLDLLDSAFGWRSASPRSCALRKITPKAVARSPVRALARRVR